MKWPERIPSWLSVAAGGYAVLGVFGLSFWRVKSGWPSLDQRTVVAISALVAAPLALAFVWQRLASLKFFGIEVSFARVTVSIEEISGAFSHQQYFSGSEHLIAQMRAVITKPEIRLIEVNLHTEPYWWSTRLFLLAALADSYSDVERIVIVEGGANRFYVGMISPCVLRESLAARFPELEVTYQQVRSAQGQGPFPADQVDRIVQK